MIVNIVLTLPSTQMKKNRTTYDQTRTKTTVLIILRVFLVFITITLTFSVNPQDSGRSIKSHKHDRDPSVTGFVEVTCRLDPAARQVHVPELFDHDIFAVVVVGVGRGGRQDLPGDRL